MAKRRKLTKEEKKERNKKLREKIAERNQDATSYEDQQRIVHILSGKNVAMYFLTVFVPPVGVPLLWKKREELHLNTASLIVWTMVGTIILIQYIRLIINAVA